MSVIIPTLNIGNGIRPTLESVKGLVNDIVVSDGRSSDFTVDFAKKFGAKVICGERGRGRQLHLGTEVAEGEWLLFLHADTTLKEGWLEETQKFMGAGMDKAGVFQFALNDVRWEARLIEKGVNLRCRWLGLPYGDQGLFMSRGFYEQLGGYKPIPLFEDVDIIRRIGRRRLVFFKSQAVTSALSYQTNGFYFRPIKNLMLLLLYLFGVSPRYLEGLYK
ncbi:MAG: glycosyl transferase family 2 [Rhodospirillaceae bacterium]|nr:glycosyl transferase family 2 [Rhodospirillaceae bacterium]